VITALVTWYTSAAGVINGTKARPVLPSAVGWAAAPAARYLASTQAHHRDLDLYHGGAPPPPASLAW
jgi:hypothetical protein